MMSTCTATRFVTDTIQSPDAPPQYREGINSEPNDGARRHIPII